MYTRVNPADTSGERLSPEQAPHRMRQLVMGKARQLIFEAGFVSHHLTAEEVLKVHETSDAILEEEQITKEAQSNPLFDNETASKSEVADSEDKIAQLQADAKKFAQEGGSYDISESN